MEVGPEVKNLSHPKEEAGEDEEVVLPRLEFNRDVFDIGINYLDHCCTCAMQGKIFYKWRDLTYTQSRDDIPKRMFIRGKELEKETYLPLFETFNSLTEKYDDMVVVLMVSRQDLLITHPIVEGVQVFFLGCIVSDVGFCPASSLVETNDEIRSLAESSEMVSVQNYSIPNRVYIPSRIMDPESLSSVLRGQGSFVCTKDGVPVTISTEQESQVFEYFSNTQNNIQLFVRLFFLTPFDEDDEGPNEIADVGSRVERVSAFSPLDKTAEFVSLVEKFRALLSFFDDKKVYYGLAQNNKEIYMEHDSIDEREMKIMEKPLKSLNTFLENIKWNLKNNRKRGTHKRVPLPVQVKNSIFAFFRFSKNVNNCCHLLKHVERLSIR